MILISLARIMGFIIIVTAAPCLHFFCISLMNVLFLHLPNASDFLAKLLDNINYPRIPLLISKVNI